MNASNNESLDTAIEPDNRESDETGASKTQRLMRKLRCWSNQFLDMIGSESSLFILLFIHWAVSCMLHLFFSDRGQVISEKLSFVAMIYFIAMLLVFISMMTTVSIFMIPLVSISFFMQLFIIYIFLSHVFEIPQHNPMETLVCEKTPESWICHFFQGRGGIGGIIVLVLGLFLYTTTLIAMADQAARNMVTRQRQVYRERQLMYMNMMHSNRNTPVGPVNTDEPPRYSTLEHPATPPRVVPENHSLSTETSPPRYSYWERTLIQSSKRSTAGSNVKIPPSHTV